MVDKMRWDKTRGCSITQGRPLIFTYQHSSQLNLLPHCQPSHHPPTPRSSPWSKPPPKVEERRGNRNDQGGWWWFSLHVVGKDGATRCGGHGSGGSWSFWPGYPRHATNGHPVSFYHVRITNSCSMQVQKGDIKSNCNDRDPDPNQCRWHSQNSCREHDRGDNKKTCQKVRLPMFGYTLKVQTMTIMRKNIVMDRIRTGMLHGLCSGKGKVGSWRDRDIWHMKGESTDVCAVFCSHGHFTWSLSCWNHGWERWGQWGGHL